MRNVFIISAYIKIIYGTIKYVRRAHLIYVINILGKYIRGEFITPRPRPSQIRYREDPREIRAIYLRYHRWLRYTDTGAFIGERWKREPRVGPWWIREAERKKTAPTRRGDNLAEGKKRRGVRFIATTAPHVRVRPYIALLISGA